MSIRVSIHGEDSIGLFGIATDRYAILSGNFPEIKVLSVPSLRTSIYGTSLVGVFCAGNSNGLLLPYFIPDEDIEKIEEFFKMNKLNVEIGKILDNYTAIGNLIACNDNAAIVSPLLSDTRVIKRVLGVKVRKRSIGNHNEVGACCVATNRGFIVHPDAENELKKISRILGVDGGAGTVNLGFPFVRSGIVANSYGYIAGSRTTGIELGRIETALGFLD
ncbi:MAG: translation initiation factor IF-6 [Candidatus Altiarchaeales archaeon]|nr:MAG: translation initiation factor IF-6 [Candidatus Altiarchaeales archaeon]